MLFEEDQERDRVEGRAAEGIKKGDRITHMQGELEYE